MTQIAWPERLGVDEIALGLLALLVLAHLVRTIVLWTVRLRFSLSDVDPRLAPQHESAPFQQLLVMPDFRQRLEAHHPSTHQGAARRPELRPPGPGAARVTLGPASGRRSPALRGHGRRPGSAGRRAASRAPGAG